MGRLRRDDHDLTLSAWSTVGRAQGSTIHLDDAQVSGAHAVLSWSGDGWTVRDLSSRNGTWLDGRRLPPGEQPTLTLHAELRFGPSGAAFIVTDLSAPPARAIPLHGGTPVEGSAQLLALPDLEQPQLTLVLTEQGWMLETASAYTPVADGAELALGDQRWQVQLPAPLLGTVPAGPALRLDQLALRFEVSADEEHVRIYADHPAGTLEIPPRAHHYTLLTLARSRLRDRGRGIAPSEEGWEDVERLARRLGVTGNAFHVQLCRARAQLGALGVDQVGGIFERRGVGRVRLGVARLDVRRPPSGNDV